MDKSAALAALEFYADHGVDVIVGDEPVNRFLESQNFRIPESQRKTDEPANKNFEIPRFRDSDALLGTSESKAEAIKLAGAANTLEELKQAIEEFEGIALKKTATNLVFCDGNPEAPVMLVGEAPGADEDRLGKPFVGVSGQLLDRILACIGLDRAQEDPAKAVYISNILNWRPPGNRTPAPGEIEVSLPFIERHIQLVQPRLLIFCGGVSAKSLLGSEKSISKLRTIWHDYLPQTSAFQAAATPIPAIATFHPAYLLRTPLQKKSVWADMLALQQKREDLNLI